MRLALIAILLAVVVTVSIHAFSPNRRAKMVATFRNKWIVAERCLSFVFGYAVPIYLLLYVDSCSQWLRLNNFACSDFDETFSRTAA